MARELQKIIVMGLGYIGLPTASMLATKGHQVLGVDVNARAVDTINSGRIFITLRDKAERVGRNPKTGIEVPITPRRVVTFRASQMLKDQIARA